jgi:flagellar hook-basal body complex protein FliE
MVVSELNAARQYMPLIQQRTEGRDIGYTPSAKFTDSLKELIDDTNSLQKDSAELTEKMIKGEPVDLHDVMIASEKAKTSFQLLLEMRNKFLDLYREVSRVQV